MGDERTREGRLQDETVTPAATTRKKRKSPPGGGSALEQYRPAKHISTVSTYD